MKKIDKIFIIVVISFGYSFTTNVNNVFIRSIAKCINDGTAHSKNSSAIHKIDSNKLANLSVDNGQTIIDSFLGVNAVYHGFAFMKSLSSSEAPELNDGDRQREFQRIQSMNLKIARTIYRLSWACNSSIYNHFDWESERMKEFYAWLDEMKSLKVDVALGAGWNFPKDTYYGHNLPDSSKDISRFAHWVNESLYQMIKVRGYNNIKYLILFTEPLNYPVKNIQTYYTTPEYYAKVCIQINDSLKKSGLRSYVKLVGPNSGSTDTAAFIGWSVKRLNNIIDIYSWHTYNGKFGYTNPPLEYDDWKKIVDVGRMKIISTKKPFWIDEYAANKPDETVRTKADYGNYLAQCVAAFTNAGAQTSLIWLLFDQKYDGSHSTNKDGFHNGVQLTGLVKYPHDSSYGGSHDVFPAYYAFNLMSRFFGDRTPMKVYKTANGDSIYIAAVQSQHKLSLLVVNSSHVKRNFSVHFAKPINCSLNKYLYDPSNIIISHTTDEIEASGKLNNIKNVFNDIIPSRGVCLYTIEN